MISSILLGAAIASDRTPPVMLPRSIGPAAPITGGTVSEIEIGPHKATLFIPTGANTKRLWVHFHTAAWFVVAELQRAPIQEPVLTFNLGQGSATYAKPFPANGAFAPWLAAAEAKLGVPVEYLRFTSFSAGYGAVRNLVDDPAVLNKLDLVVLCDSLYAGFEPGSTTREVLKSQVDCWRPLAQKAIDGKATFVITTSQIAPDTYAGTFEVAAALVQSMGGQMQPVSNGDRDETQKLLKRYDRGRWHVWSYDGADAEAHVTHPRRLAEVLLEVLRS